MCVLSDVKSAVILSIVLFTCSVTDISAEVPLIGVKVLQDGRSGHKVSLFGGDICRGHQRRGKRESGSVFGPLKIT